MKKVQASVGQAWAKLHRVSHKFGPKGDEEDSNDNTYDAPKISKRSKAAVDGNTQDLVTEAARALAQRYTPSDSTTPKIEVEVRTAHITPYDGADDVPEDAPGDIPVDGPEDIPLPESDDEGEA